jgi:AcrR family transcriptional regulator
MGKKALQAEETRYRLIQIAADLFATKGFEQTSVDEVLARAGVSKGALYHHFANKEALFDAVCRAAEAKVMEKVAKAAADASDPLGKLRAGCQKWLDLTMDRRVRQIALIDGPAVLGWQRWREIDEEFSFGLTKHVLQAAIDAGQIREQNVDLLAHMALGMMGEAAMVIARAKDVKKARAEAGEAVDRLIDAMARG